MNPKPKTIWEKANEVARLIMASPLILVVVVAMLSAAIWAMTEEFINRITKNTR